MEQIEKDVLQLKESMDILHDLVSDQKQEIDTIENMIIQSKEETKNAVEDLNSENTSFTRYGYVAGLMTILLFFFI